MYLQIPYSELSSLIRNKIGSDVEITYVDSSSIEVGTTINMDVFFTKVSKYISAIVSIDRLVGTDLGLYYSINMLGGNFLANKLEPFLSRHVKPDTVELRPSNNVVVHLAAIDQLHDVLEKIDIQGISFEDSNISIAFSIKTDNM